MYSKNPFYNFVNYFVMFMAYGFVYLPIFVLACVSFKHNPSLMTAWDLSFKWYAAVFVSKEMLAALGVSLLVAVVATFFSIVLGLALAVSCLWGVYELFLLPFLFNMMIPEIMIGIGVLIFFVFAKIPLGFYSLIAGHTILGLGISVPVFHTAISEFDSEILEASTDLGATRIQTLRLIIVPMLKSVIVTTAFIVFTLSLDDFFVSLFCSGAGIDTISTFVYAKIRSSIDPSLNALSVIVMSISMFLALFLFMSSRLSDKVICNEKE